MAHREIAQGRSKATSAKYRLYLTRLLAFCRQADIAPHQVTHDHLETFTGLYVFKHMNMGPAARRAVVAAVKGFYKYLYEHNHIPANPAQRLVYPQEPKRLPKALPLDAAERLMWAPDLGQFTGIRDAAIIGLLIGCGLRASGLVNLNTNDLIWSRAGLDEQLAIRVIEKGDKQRQVPVPDAARLLLRAYLGHHYLQTVNRDIGNNNQVLFISTRNSRLPAHLRYGEALRLSPRSIRDMLIKYGTRAGIPRQYLHPHALRHLYGKELAEDDVDVLDRMALMGHATVKSAEVYSHITDRKLRRIADASNPLSKINTPVSELLKHLEQSKP